VFIAENGIFSNSTDSAQISGPWTARVVKYIANRAAKNINSLESQTIVPTATILGRLSRVGGVATALDMRVIIPDKPGKSP
jgi:hypothetical protein